MAPILKNWHPDTLTSLLTLAVTPVLIVLMLSIRRFLRNTATFFIDGLLYYAARPIDQKMSAGLSLRRYCYLQLSGPSRFLNVPGAKDVSLETDDIFVPLTLEQSGNEKLCDHSTLLDVGNRIRLIGDPGSGKSSVAKRLFRDACRSNLKWWGSTARFPVLIELKTLDIPDNLRQLESGDWLLSHLRAYVSRFAAYEIGKSFETALQQKGVLIILDGLDEVAAGRYDRVCLAINELSERLSALSENNIIVLTMRSQFHVHVRDSYITSFPILLTLRRFSPSDIYTFLTLWPFDLATRVSDVVRIYGELTDRPALREMCTNPLVLSMYVAQDQSSGHHLPPESRTEFYRQVTDELIVRRRARQVGANAAQMILKEQRLRILGKLALLHLCDGNSPANMIPWKLAVSVAKTVIATDNDEEAALALRTLSKETGLITEEREGEILRFIHLTFCEFLAATEAVQGHSEGWASLVSSHVRFRENKQTASRLAETIPFAAALTLRHARNSAIADIENFSDNRILARTFLETKAYDHPLWLPFVDNYRTLLLSIPEQSWDAEWLSEVHLFLVVAADADRSASLVRGIPPTNAVGAFFRQLAGTSRDSLVRLVGAYARHDAIAAFRIAELSGIDIVEQAPQIVSENVDQPAFLGVALQGALKSAGRENLWISLLTEAGLRSPVAAMLMSSQSYRPWRALAEEVPNKHQWLLSGHIKPSLYSDCLALTHQHLSIEKRQPVGIKAAKLVERFGCIQAPGSTIVVKRLAFISNWTFSYLAFSMYGVPTIAIFLDINAIFGAHLSTMAAVTMKAIAAFMLVFGLIFLAFFVDTTIADFKRIVNIPNRRSTPTPRLKAEVARYSAFTRMSQDIVAKILDARSDQSRKRLEENRRARRDRALQDLRMTRREFSRISLDRKTRAFIVARDEPVEDPDSWPA